MRPPRSKPLVLAIREPVEMGRECDGLLLADPEVSRRHAVVRFEGKELVIEDLGSTNGTTVNGVRIEVPVPLWENDIVRLGGTELRLVPGTAATGGGSGVASAGAVVRGKADTSGARMTSIESVAASVDEESAKVASQAAVSGTITIVFSDIESSTEYAMSLGDQRWFEVLGEHNEIIQSNLAKHRGNVVKNQGDGFMLTFPSARGALLCMIDVQRALATRAAETPDSPIRIRIGMHTGEAMVDAEGDLFGKHIIMAARIANLADGGQIFVSSLTKEITASGGDLKFGPPMELELKGIEGIHHVYNVIWNDSAGNADDTAVGPAAPSAG
ncbi:MAG TPA: adenylate/guanylate cyclase domain-containing protein [Acidimicrobiia bacterium]|nr:adenylate/guanylate cyclase domain-containing protein [Acidimicrobiia bacterium]